MHNVNKQAKRIHFYTTRLAKMLSVHPSKRTDRWDHRMARLQAYKRIMDHQLPDPQDILR